MTTSTPTRCACELEKPCRNHYYFGKLLDVDHFRMETNYFNYMRRMHNRLVLGHGVVCGLDVELSKDGKHVEIRPGVALDGCGREIVVPCRSKPIRIDSSLAIPMPEAQWKRATKQEKEHKKRTDKWVHLVICYLECESQFEPAHAGQDCHEEPSQPSVVCERYSACFRKGYLPRPDRSSPLSEKDWEEYVKHVSRDCPPCPKDSCIPLANVRIPDRDPCTTQDVDILVRPIAFNRVTTQVIHADI